MNNIFNFDVARENIINSNINATRNRNLYPIQEQATLREVWDRIPCNCSSDCACKKYGCTYHWILKENIDFNQLLPAFIRMFTDKGLHRRLLNWVKNGTVDPSEIPNRARGVLSVLLDMKYNWTKLHEKAIRHNKTLICDHWYNDFWRKQWNFSIQGTSIYKAKQFCILLPDIGVPYDNNSRKKILMEFKASDMMYFEILKTLRNYITHSLDSEKKTLSDFRKLDKPQDQLPFKAPLISLRNDNIIYGNSYIPIERPITRIIDKYFYLPSKGESDKYRDKNPPVSNNKRALYPLSGRGKQIYYTNYESGRKVAWGSMYFDLPDALIDDILDNFFVELNKWYPLGASMTEPIKNGLGKYIQERVPPFTPRHASAIAAIMVQDNLIDFRGKKPIELKKS